MIIKTQKGFGWEKLSDSRYKDITTGITWFMVPMIALRYEDALLLEDSSSKLPDLEQLELAYKHGSKEVMALANKRFWIKSNNKYGDTYAILPFDHQRNTGWDGAGFIANVMLISK